MNAIKKLLIIASIVFYIAVATGCGPGSQVKTEPTVVKPSEPTVEELRKPVAKDPTIYKAGAVIKEYGRLKKKHISYKKYQDLTKGQANAAMDPDWFYDSYILDLNEKNYWMNVTFGTSKKAVANDPRIQKIMSGLPEQSINIRMKTPRGKTYLLTDADADGVLDFAIDAAQKKVTKVDIQLLDKMQEKYTWIIGLIKKHYKKK